MVVSVPLKTRLLLGPHLGGLAESPLAARSLLHEEMSVFHDDIGRAYIVAKEKTLDTYKSGSCLEPDLA